MEGTRERPPSVVWLPERAARRIDSMTPPVRGNGGVATLRTGQTSIAAEGQVIDLIAVERAINGAIDPAELTRAERQAAGRVLLARGHGPREVARRTGLSQYKLKAGDLESVYGRHGRHGQGVTS